MTTSRPLATSTGHGAPNGPRTPISPPAFNRVRLLVIEPTALIV
jgi:hypothetical protein